MSFSFRVFSSLFQGFLSLVPVPVSVPVSISVSVSVFVFVLVFGCVFHVLL